MRFFKNFFELKSNINGKKKKKRENFFYSFFEMNSSIFFARLLIGLCLIKAILGVTNPVKKMEAQKKVMDEQNINEKSGLLFSNL